jgi:gliding motility-associated-like protein
LTPPAICNNALFSYTPTSLTGIATFSWNRNTLAGISNAAANGTDDPSETLQNTTTAALTVPYVYTMVSTNGCTNTQTVSVSVGPSPALISTLTPPDICSNTVFSYTPQSLTAFTTFNWTRSVVAGISNASGAGSGSPNETLVNTTNGAINVTYVYTLSVAGCINPTTYNVVVKVNPISTLTSSTNPAAVCSGSTFSYTATTSAGGALGWTRASVPGIIQASGSGPGNISEFLTNSTASPITVTYIYTITLNGCVHTDNVNVVVNPNPVLSSSLTTPPVCSASSLNYIATSTTLGATYAWTRATIAGISQAGVSGVGNINEVLTNTTFAPIQVVYVYTVTANGCTNPATFSVLTTVNPLPATPSITPSGTTAICAGTSTILTAPAGYTYLWSNGAATQTTVVNTAGNYSVVVIDANGCHSAPSPAATITITPTATVSAGNDGTVCEGSSFTVPAGAFTLNSSARVWSSSGSGLLTSANTLNPIYTPSSSDVLNGSVVLTLTANNIAPCTGSVHDEMTLKIQAAPTANAGIDKSVCFPSTIMITGVASGYASLNWTTTGAGVLLDATTLTPTYYPDIADVGNNVTLTLTVVGKSPCVSTATDVMLLHVDAYPGNPGTITGLATVCKGVPTTYFVAPIANAVGYTWTLPTGTIVVSGSNTNNLTVVFNGSALPGNVAVYGTNSCGNGPISTKAVTITDIPANPGSISGSPSLCQGTTGIVFTVTPVVGATSYFWTVPAGATITSTPPLGNSITVDFAVNASSGNVTVYASNTCGNGPLATKAVTLNARPPAQVISALGGATTICEGNSVPLVGATAGYNYLWTPGGATSMVNLATVTGSYSVVVTNPITGCSSNPSNAIAITVNPAPARPTSTGSLTFCWDGTAALPTLDANTVTSVPAGVSLFWFDAPTGGNTVVTPTLSVLGTKTYYAEAQDNITNCPSLTRTPVILTISSYPATPVKGPDVNSCETSPIITITATTLTPPPAGTTIFWYLNPTGGLPVSPTLSTVGTKTFYAEANNGTCVSTARSAGVVLTINQAPLAPISGGDITQCENIPHPIQTITATATLPTGLPAGSTIANSIRWYDQAVNGNLVANPTLNTLGTITYYAEIKNYVTNCVSLTRTPVKLSIISHPVAPVVTGNIEECEKSPLQTLTATATVPSGSTVNWYDQAVNGNIVTPTLNAVATKTIYAETDNGSCTSLTRTPITLTINPAPAVPVSKGNKTTCYNAGMTPLLPEVDAPPANVRIDYYDVASGGSAIVPTPLNTVGTATYYAEAVNTITGCASLTRSAAIVLLITPMPAPPVAGPDQTQCVVNPIQKLTATATVDLGSTLVWYSALTGGSVVADPSINSVTTKTYYAGAKIGDCESTRVPVTLKINPAPSTPVPNVILPKCDPQSLLATATPIPGATLFYYTTPTGGAPVDNTWNTVGTATFYAEAVDNTTGCISINRSAPIVLTINATPKNPTSLGDIITCATTPIVSLNANNALVQETGITYTWFDLANNVISAPALNAIGTKTYYVEASTSTCKSAGRTAVTLTIKTTPVAPLLNLTYNGKIVECENAAGIQTLDANNAIVANPSTTIKWYDAAVAGNVITPPKLNSVGTITYFAEAVDNLTGCPSLTRTQVDLTIDGLPAAPISSGSITACASPLLSDLNANNAITVVAGTKIKWYDAVGNVVTAPTLNTVGTTKTYYAEAINLISGCVSATKTAVVLTINALPVTTITADIPNPVCEGAALTLSGPAGMTTYSWTGPNGFTSTIVNPQFAKLSKAAGGLYTLTVVDANGCTNVGKYTVAVTPAGFNGTYGPYCTTDLPVTLSASPAGGTFTGTGVTGNTFTPAAAGLGSFVINYTAPGGACPIAPVTITVVPSPVVTPVNQALIDCTTKIDLTAPAITIGSTAGLLYSYWTDAAATIPLANPNAVGVAGTYYIKGTTPSGKCSTIAPVVIAPSNSLLANITMVAPTCLGSATGTMTATVTKGTAPYTYQWNSNPVQNTATATKLVAGAYSVTITDAATCSITLTDTLKDRPTVKIIFAHKDIECFNDINGSARVERVDSLNGTPSNVNLYTYKWNTTPVQTTREALKLTFGYYTVTMTSAKGCAIKDSVLIAVTDTTPPTITCPANINQIVTLAKGANPLLSGANSILVDLGKPVVWDNCGIRTVTNDAPDKYKIGITEVIWTVTDFSGLTDTCTQIVNLKSWPEAPQLFSPNGDGINDNFEIYGITQFPKSQLYVYTRSGQLVYSSEDYQNDWDGRYTTSGWSKKQIVAPGVYYYILNLGAAIKKIQGFVYINY